MSAPINPFGLHTITPYLIVENVTELIVFLKKVFHARQRGEAKVEENGRVIHAEVSIGDSVVMMGEPTEDFPAVPASLYTYVADCDATYAKALSMGATAVMKPTTFPHGDRYGGVKDLSGNTWWVVTNQSTSLRQDTA